MKKTSSFLAGMATALLIVSLTTSALAASGNVSFSFANVAVDGKTQITAGSTITAPNGQQIPGSILYTDEAGGKRICSSSCDFCEHFTSINRKAYFNREWFFESMLGSI